MSDKSLQMIADKLQEAASTAWPIALQVERVDAVLYLTTAFLVCVIGAVTARALYPQMIKAYEVDGLDADGPKFGWTLLFGVALIASCVGGGTVLLSPWAWVTAFDPSLGIAHMAIAKVLAH